MTSPNEIAKAKVTIEADNKAAVEAIKETVDRTEDLGDAAEGVSNRVGGAFESMGTKIDKSTAGVRKFTGAISGAVGAVTAMIGVFGVLSSAISGLLILYRKKSERLEELRSSYEDIKTQIDDFDLSGTLDEFEKFEHQINKNVDSLVEQNKITEAAAESLRKQAAIVAENRRELARAEQSEVKRLERNARELELIRKRGAAIQELNRMIADQNVELLPSEDQIVARAELAKKRLEEAFSSFVLPEGLLDQAFENVDELARRQIEAEQERQRVADEAQRRRDDEADRRSQERAQREVEIIRAGLESLTNSDFITTLESIPKALGEMTNTVRRLKQ